MDGDKAFDCLSWPFLLATLEYVGITGRYLNTIKALYSSPHGVIKLPHATSNGFIICNGTRQGCPLSPLIFALGIEPLAAAIMNKSNIFGVEIKSRQFIIYLCMDDVLLTMTNPLSSLPNLHIELELYNEYYIWL